MNREQRRKYNKKYHTHYTKEEFEASIALAYLQNGKSISLKNLQGNNYIHMDNEVLAPEGVECILNYSRIKERFDKNSAGYQEGFQEWVENNKNNLFHLTRDGAMNSLVCLKEDFRKVEVDGEVQEAPKWLFDVYSDLLFKDAEGNWKMLFEIDNETNNSVMVDFGNSNKKNNI